MDEPAIAASDLSAAHARLRRLHALLFYPVLVFAGLTNSFFVAESGLHRFLFPSSVLCLVLYFAYLLRISTPFLRMLWLIGMFMCAFGENFLVYALDMYNFSPTVQAPYAIPPYVILGHGYALWTAYVIGDWLSDKLARAVRSGSRSQSGCCSSSAGSSRTAMSGARAGSSLLRSSSSARRARSIGSSMPAPSRCARCSRSSVWDCTAGTGTRRPTTSIRAPGLWPIRLRPLVRST